MRCIRWASLSLIDSMVILITIASAASAADSATPEALILKRTDETITIDGKLDEPVWSLAQKIANAAQGTPKKQASFAMTWRLDPKSKSVAWYVAIKVLDGPAGKTPKDAVHVYIDGLHNRELVYNADDTHFIFGRDGKCRSLKGKPNWFIKSAAAEIEGGYVLEIQIPWNYFSGEGAWFKAGPKTVYGFDLVVDEGDKDISRQAWRGSAKDDDDTSGFGSIVLTEK